MSTDLYQKNWDLFYKAQKRFGKTPLWDVEPERSAGRDWELFNRAADRNLGLLDIGCGYGKEAQWFLQHFPHVLATDVSPSALEQGRASFNSANLEFEFLDLTEVGAGARIRAERGPLNIYIRGVLHQIASEDWPVAFENMRDLMDGSDAACFCIEVAPNIRDYFEQNSGNFRSMPLEMQEALFSHLPPRGLTTDQLLELASAANLKAVHSEVSHLATRIAFQDGSEVRIPASTILLKIRS